MRKLQTDLVHNFQCGKGYYLDTSFTGKIVVKGKLAERGYSFEEWLTYVVQEFIREY